MKFLENPLLRLTDKGIYCAIADVYLDPHRAVDKALISHAHADHAYPGSKYYLSADSSKSILKHRIGQNINIESLPYGKSLQINGVEFTFYPAGHITGSALILTEHKGERWLYTGDFKTEKDGVSEDFEALKTHVLITETTFGLPIFKWRQQENVMREINAWWANNKSQNKLSVIYAYSLGKAQRILKYLEPSIGRILLHKSVFELSQIIENQGVAFPQFELYNQLMGQKDLNGSVLIIPPNSDHTYYKSRIKDFEIATCSGWNATLKKYGNVPNSECFVLSDHADWDGILNTVKDCEAEMVLTTHGFTAQSAKYIDENICPAFPLEITKS